MNKPFNLELIHEIKGKICYLTLNNPEKRNVLTPSLLNTLSTTLEKLKEENEIRCVVIKGAGDKAFSSGYDISAIKEDDMTREFTGDHPLETFMNSLENFPYPTIAMMNGHTFGAGLELAATCDIRICSDKAKLGIPPVKLGVVYSFSGTKKFLKLLGIANTKELFLAGQTIDANRAIQIGLVNHVKNNSEIEEFTFNMANEISQNAPLSLKTMKKLINISSKSYETTPEEERLIKEMFEEVQNSEDYREGQKAFEEKRKPLFKGN